MADTKLSAVRAAMDAGDWQRALALAARFRDLGEERKAILDAHTAYTNPRWAVQMGGDLDAIESAGAAALVRRYPVKASV